MVLRKTTLIILLLTILLQACTDDHHSSRSNLDKYMSKNTDQMLQQVTSDLLFQDSVLHIINMELNKIDSMFIFYQDNIEHDLSQNSQAHSIVRRIKALNNNMLIIQNELENKTLENTGLIEMLGRLQKELLSKERRIAELTNTVNRQDLELTQKSKTISNLNNLNTQQQQDLQRLENEITRVKTNAYINLADLLVQIAEEMPEIRGLFTQRSKNKHKQLQTKLIKDAFNYYNEAAIIGDTIASMKKEALKNKYSFLDQ